MNFTWDATYLYLQLRIEGTATTGQHFYYLAFDTDNDGLMESNEPVLGIRWNTNTGGASALVGVYVASAGGGDPMTSGGTVNGYALPGSVNFGAAPAGVNGDADGNATLLEARVTWAALGVSAGSAVRFRASSTTATNYPAGATNLTESDHIGRCTTLGGAATTQYANLTFQDAGAATSHGAVNVQPAATSYAAWRVTNTGNFSDTFNFTSTQVGQPHNPSVAYYQDVNQDGAFDVGDTLLTDGADAGSDVDSGALAVSGVRYIIAAYTMQNTSCVAPAGTATTTLVATSAFDTARNATVTDAHTIVRSPGIAIAKSTTAFSDPVNSLVNPKRIPGGVVTNSIVVSNSGKAPIDADTVIVVDQIPANTELKLTEFGGGPVQFVDGATASGLTYTFTALGSMTDDVDFSTDGSDWTLVPTPDGNGVDPAVNHLRIRPKGTMGCNITGAPSFTVDFRTRVE
jgi:uncharacterized repeat protein (TIGR01451 family)